MPNAILFGLAGLVLTPEEKSFFRDCDPLGYILFSRNVESPDQLRFLTSSLREISGRENVPILIDQEGGRVARLRPPYWRETLPAGRYTKLARIDGEAAKRAVYVNHLLMAYELADLGINVDCAPVADLRLPGAHDIIGDRAFGATASDVIPLARAAGKGLMDGGIIPIMKHIPGHGRAGVDSHFDLPIVDHPLEELRSNDFAVFRALKDIPWAMTAHIIYSAVDKEQPATLSKIVIDTVIRKDIDFQGLLVSDDLGMKALSGSFSELARRSLAAGCDVALHCSGNMTEMAEVIKGVSAMNASAIERLERGWQSVKKDAYIDAPGLRAELSDLMEKTPS